LERRGRVSTDGNVVTGDCADQNSREQPFPVNVHGGDYPQTSGEKLAMKNRREEKLSKPKKPARRKTGDCF
jgi:hypothetical protein